MPTVRSLAFLLSVLLVARAGATTEPSPLALRLVAEGARLRLEVTNRSDQGLPVSLEVSGPARRGLGSWTDSVELGAGATIHQEVGPAPGGRGTWVRARAWIRGTSAYVETRLFAGPDGPQDLASWLAGRTGLLVGQEPIERPGEVGTVSGRLAFTDSKGQLRPLARAKVTVGGAAVESGPDGSFSLGGVTPGKVRVTVALECAHWSIHGAGEAASYRYVGPEFELPADAGAELGELQLPAGDPVSEAAWIHGIASQAADFLAAQGGDLGWWDHLPIEWPADGDYYGWGTLHITQAHQWDVVGHELGHAVYFAASSFAGGGGSHKIDECYTQGLALSEGWASFFSAAVQLDRADPDAKFEFMVPRRAPIRVEHVPADVCAGEKNEWRTASMLWDLYDTHEDGEDRLALDWNAAGWSLMRSGTRIKGPLAMLAALEATMDPDTKGLADRVARQNRVRLTEAPGR